MCHAARDSRGKECGGLESTTHSVGTMCPKHEAEKVTRQIREKVKGK